MEIYEELGMLQVEPDYPNENEKNVVLIVILMEE